MVFIMIPRISAHAMEVITTLPIAIDIPPIPVIRITDTVKRFA
jgi:hypothetical protein